MSILDTLRQFLFLYLLFDRAIVWGGSRIHAVLFTVSYLCLGGGLPWVSWRGWVPGPG